MKIKQAIAGLVLMGSILVVSGFTRIDNDPVGKIISALEKWMSIHPQEKVYLHLDKPYYAVGDNIWFKAYVTAGGSHQLSAISGVLNVELINDKDSVKQSIKLPVINGLAWGDFALADSLKEGNYRVRAYTGWMRNAGDEYFFDETIPIVNSVSNNVFTNATYIFSTQNGQQNINAVINYAALDGAPYAGKQVSYEVDLGQNRIAKGKGETDDKGNLSLNFVNTTPQIKLPGRIITHIKLPGEKPVEKAVLIKATSGKVDVQFFPEGGTLVNGNESEIAFKAVGADGLGVDVKGSVLDDQGNRIATFASSHLGMGVFVLKPQKDKIYTAKITYADGSENAVPLPMAVNSGYSLSVANADENNISVKIEPGYNVIANGSQNDVLSVVAQSGGVIYYGAKSTPGSKYFTATVPKRKFPTGIVQFTLFSATGEPINERLIFVQNHDQLKLDVTTDRQSYSPRQQVTIGLDAKDAAGKSVVGSFSVSVIDETKVPHDDVAGNTILSNLLLTSELRGYIEKPNYYFENPDNKTAADLDVLMLTQGYHRFEWKEVLSGNYPPVKWQPEKTLQISGHIKNLFGKPVAHGKVTLFTTAGGIFLIDTVSDSDGRFTFKNLVFRDSVKFLIQARTEKNRKNIQIDIDEVARQNTGLYKNAPDLLVNISDGRSAFLQNSKSWYAGQLKSGLASSSILLKQVEITAKKIQVENSSNLNGPGNADQVIGADDIATMGCAKITDCLQGRIVGVIFRDGVPYLLRNNRVPMNVVLDGISVDKDILDDLNPNDIQSIEVLRNIAYTSIYGGRGGGGVLVITSKKGRGNYSIERYAPGILMYGPKGYYKARAFYSPQYDAPGINTQIPDLRSTIYWKPNVITGANGKALFEFFNADSKGVYEVVIEGIDNNGDIGRQVLRYKVE